MHASGLTSAPITKFLLIFLATTSIFANVTDSQHLLPLLLEPHLLASSSSSHASGYQIAPQRQLWRLLTYTTAYANTTELLFGSLALYNLRVVERLWGSRKFLSFILQTTPVTVLATPVTMLALRAIAGLVLPSSSRAESESATSFNYLPPGPTGLIFALLAQYYAAVPYTHKYVTTGAPREQGAGVAEQEEEEVIQFTSKSTSYIVPAQLALSQLPGSFVTAAVGWCVGLAWRRGLVWPGTRWRVPWRS